ncbi:hypothetical protein AJ79_07773 [Helicocarpus griseus UAMH5409]|uniref:Cytochrome P450 n=1 Tax=Helicocarpus griseus UAMH5409 TaxID=1447875 RepID=A0A2B7WZM7_9EURO|nr:hypothetical protein AJ79_07773 [Helicocarpus griseus UAMH5409]
MPPPAILSGIILHVGLYRVGEWDLSAPKIFTTYSILTLCAALYYKSHSMMQENGELLAMLSSFIPAGYPLRFIAAHIATVYASMLLYRAFFHRLRHFPGPFMARLSNIYFTFLSAKDMHRYDELDKLHKKHGDYVRVGPTVLSILDPEAVQAFHGSHSKVSKGQWHTVLMPRVSLQVERNKREHARRRKIWDMGFSSKALRSYEPRIRYYTEQLVSKIERTLDKPIDMAQWFNYYSFDVMGTMGFNMDSNMVKEGTETYFLKTLHADMKNIGIFGHLPWLLPFVKATPGLNKEYLNFWKWLDVRVNERIASKPDSPDIFQWLLEDYEKRPKTRQDELNLHGDAYLTVVAGSDTTAATLTNLFFHLACEKRYLKQLQAELDQLSDLSSENIQSIKFLDALIHETLRLHPAVPSGMQRVTPPEGLQIGKTYIPGDIMVQIPLHSLFRDERNFVHPNDFVPERWLSQPELVKNAGAFIPFSIGSYSCVGKQFALSEMRMAAAEILYRFDVELAPGQTQKAFLDGAQDAFTLVTAPLNLVFRKRKF